MALGISTLLRISTIQSGYPRKKQPENFRINPKEPHGGIQWDGLYFTVLHEGNIIDRYSPSNGRSGPPVGTVSLTGPKIYWDYDSIQGSILAVGQGSSNTVYVYEYPQGGYPTLTISGVKNAFGIAISVAPSRSHPKQRP